MEPNTSSENLNTTYEDELDVSNLIDDFAGLDFKKEEPAKKATIVFFSLDTTDRNTKISEIVQLAAGCRGSNGEINKINVYMMPEKYGIAPSTSVNKGYKIEYINGKQLQLHGNEVVARTQEEGLQIFLNFLSDQSGGTRSVLLAAHACDKIRRPVLLRHMAEYNLLPRCQELVTGFIDTLTVAQNRLQQLVTDFSLKNLATTYLGQNRLQPPLADVTVEVLMELIIHPAINFTDDILMGYATVFNFDLYSLKYDFQNLLPPNVLNAIAGAGISSANLKNEHANNNGDVSNLLQGVVNQAVIEIINARLLALANE